MIAKRIVGAVIAVAAAVSLAGCNAAYQFLNAVDPPDPNDPDDRYRLYKTVPDEWWSETIKYYTDGYTNDWANERSDLPVSDEMKNKDNKFGYLLRDLDGDGTEELLIGYADDEKETRFTELYIWHTDFGARRTFQCGDGYYMYLCEDNIIREDSWRGSETEMRFMKFDGESNAMTIIEKQGTPQKVELTPFV